MWRLAEDSFFAILLVTGRCIGRCHPTIGRNVWSKCPSWRHKLYEQWLLSPGRKFVHVCHWHCCWTTHKFSSRSNSGLNLKLFEGVRWFVVCYFLAIVCFAPKLSPVQFLDLQFCLQLLLLCELCETSKFKYMCHKLLLLETTAHVRNVNIVCVCSCPETAGVWAPARCATNKCCCNLVTSWQSAEYPWMRLNPLYIKTFVTDYLLTVSLKQWISRCLIFFNDREHFQHIFNSDLLESDIVSSLVFSTENWLSYYFTKNDSRLRHVNLPWDCTMAARGRTIILSNKTQVILADGCNLNKSFQSASFCNLLILVWLSLIVQQ